MPPANSDEKPVQITIKWSDKDDCFVARARVYDDVYMEYGETVREALDRAYEAAVQSLDFAADVATNAQGGDRGA